MPPGTIETEFSSMLELLTPNGIAVSVPETISEDPSPRYTLAQLEGARAYYLDQGYVIVSGVFDDRTCDLMRRLWAEEVKTSKSPIYRQTGSDLQVNKFNEQGWIMNPVLNPHSVDPKEFGKFREATKKKILASANLSAAFKAFLGERPKIVQAMYFEGNSATWEHHDSYYLDSEVIGTMAAGWIALEDIHAEAGRFFICPKTHRLPWPRQSKQDNVADAHDEYIKKVIETFRTSNAEIRAPALKKGDVLFWNAFTVHGSMGTVHDQHSRSSMTCHAIPASHKFLKLHHILVDVPTEDLGEALIYSPKDLARVKYRVIKWLEWNMAPLFYKAKSIAVKRAISRGG